MIVYIRSEAQIPGSLGSKKLNLSSNIIGLEEVSPSNRGHSTCTGGILW